MDAPEGTPWAIWLQSVKKQIESTLKQLKVKVFLGGTLDRKLTILKETTVNKQVQMFGGSIGAMASQFAPDLNVLELPFMFDSDKKIDFVLEKLRPDIIKILAKRGFVLGMFNVHR